MISDYTFFLSSTFKDFGQERDLLHLTVIPFVHARAAQYGQSVHVVDLRWGINTTELDISEKSNRILKICLDEIDSCRPYYIVFLGDRYGWIPEEEEISTALRQKGIVHTPASWSVTEMEIRYELFLKQADKNRVIICVRDSLADTVPPEYASVYLAESPAAAQKMDALKQWLCEEYPENILRYSASWDAEQGALAGLDGFAAALKQKMLSLLQRDWVEFAGKDTYELLQYRNRLEAERMVGETVVHSEDLSALLSLVKEKNGTICVHGEYGRQKSALMAKLALALMEEGECVFLMLCDRTPEVQNKEQLFAHMNAFIARHPDRKYYFIIDELDELVQDKDLQFHYFPLYISHKPNRHAWILNEGRRGYSHFVCDAEKHFSFSVTEADRRVLIERALRAAHKMVDRAVMDALMALCADKTPAYLQLAVARLARADRFDLAGCSTDEQINQALLSILSALPREEDALFSHLCELTAERLSPVFSQRVLELLSLSSGGLRETDLEHIFRAQGWEWNALYFAELRQYATFLLEERPGRYYALKGRLPAEQISSEAAEAFQTALDAANLGNERMRALYAREALHLALARGDRAFAERVLVSLSAFPFAEHLLVSLSKELIFFSLDILRSPLIPAAVCDALGEQMQVIAGKFSNRDMDLPEYQAVSMQCFILANAKEETAARLRSIRDAIGALHGSLGSRYMNDLPEAIPPFFQIGLDCSRRLYELGEITEREYLEDQLMRYPTMIHYLREGYIASVVNFVSRELPYTAEEYLVFLANAMHRLYRLGYRCRCQSKHLGAPREELPEALCTQEKEATEARMLLRIGTGNQFDTSISDILSYMEPEMKTAFISYLLHPEVDCDFAEWMRDPMGS